MREHDFDTPRAVALDVRVPAGEIAVEAANVTRTEVRLEPLGDDEESRTAVERAVVELRGDELLVHVHERRLHVGRSPEVHLEIRCPEGSALKAHASAADVRARGRLGAADVNCASGEVELGEVDGDLRVHAASGDVRADTVGGAATVESSSGEVRIGRLAGRGSLRLSSGDLEIGVAESSLDVHSASGDVAVREAVEGAIDVRSASGDVEIAVRPGSRVYVDARTVSGETRSDLPLSDAPGDENGPLVEIRVSSVSGDVEVTRARAVTA